MWRWDQGRMSYFNFDAIRLLAKAACATDVRTANRREMFALTGKDFLPAEYDVPWRNYARVFKLCFLTDLEGRPTSLAQKLLEPGQVESDQYFHFLATAFAVSSPAQSHYNVVLPPRWPLLFALKLLLARAALNLPVSVPLNHILAKYMETGATGEENFDFYSELDLGSGFIPAHANDAEIRQARESLKVLAQISYLNVDDRTISISLPSDEARMIFSDLKAVAGLRLADASQELKRVADTFNEGTLVMPVGIEADLPVFFPEGTRKFRTHFYLERNRNIRALFFSRRAILTCDVCAMNTKQVYRHDGLLELHHLLPLSSGSRVESRNGTILDDLVPVCPTCHRAVHKFYTVWLQARAQKDFTGIEEARGVYTSAKNSFQIGN